MLGEGRVSRPEAEARRILLEATIAVVSSCGFEAATTEMIAERAGITAAEVVRQVGDKGDCCLRAFDAVCERLDCLLLPIYLRPDPWQERIPAAAIAAARYCREHETHVRFAIEEHFRRRRRNLGESSLDLHLRHVDSVRHEVAEPERIPAAAAELAVGAFLQTLVGSHSEGKLCDFELVVPGLLYNTFRLYLGFQAAEHVLETLPQPKGRHTHSL